MLPTYKQNRNTRTILESNVIYSKKTNYKRLALESTIDIATNAQIVEQVLGNEHVQKKKLSTGKFVEDVERAWKHSLTYVDVILR